MLLGNALRYHQNDDAGAVDAYEQALAAGLAAESLIPSVHWRIARLAENTGNVPTAVHHYRVLVRDYQRSLFAHESARALARLGPRTGSVESEESAP